MFCFSGSTNEKSALKFLLHFFFFLRSTINRSKALNTHARRLRLYVASNKREERKAWCNGTSWEVPTADSKQKYYTLIENDHLGV